MPYRLLIVDDDAAVRRLLRHQLGDAFEVQESGDAAAALETMRRWRPHAVFLDLAMPGRLGTVELVQTIRREPLLKPTHLTLVSGMLETQAPQGLDGLVDALLPKPFSSQHLVEWAAKFIERAQSNEEESKLQSLFGRL